MINVEDFNPYASLEYRESLDARTPSKYESLDTYIALLQFRYIHGALSESEIDAIDSTIIGWREYCPNISYDTAKNLDARALLDRPGQEEHRIRIDVQRWFRDRIKMFRNGDFDEELSEYMVIGEPDIIDDDGGVIESRYGYFLWVLEGIERSVEELNFYALAKQSSWAGIGHSTGQAHLFEVLFPQEECAPLKLLIGSKGNGAFVGL